MRDKGSFGTKTVANSLAWKLMERFFYQGIHFVVQIILARILMPEDFSSLAILNAVVFFAAVFVQTGLSTAIVQKDKLDELDVSTALVSSLMIAAVLYAVIFFIAPMIAEKYAIFELCSTLRVMGLVLFLHSINAVQVALLQRSMQFKTIFYKSTISVILAGAIGIFLALRGVGLWALVTHSILGVLINVIVMAIGKNGFIQLRFSRDRAGRIFAFSWKILLSSLLNSLYSSSRTMLIGEKYPKATLAYYEKAYNYTNLVVQTTSSSFGSVMLPVLSSKQNNKEELLKASRRAIRMNAFIMFPILIGIAAAAEPLVNVILTEKWLESAMFFRIFCFLYLPNCFVQIDKQAYFALGRSDAVLFYEICNCSINILVLLLCVNYGVIAIALGAMCVELSTAFIIFLFSKRIYGYTFLHRVQDMWKPLLSSFAMYFIVSMVGQLDLNKYIGLLAQIAAGIAMYVVASFILRDDSFHTLLSMVRQYLKREGKE